MKQNRTKILQEVIKIRFIKIYDNYSQGEIGNEDAADLLGINERTFRRKKVRYEEEGFAGLLDRRIGHLPSNKVPVDKVEGVLRLYKEEYYEMKYLTIRC
jgi:transposase